MSLKSRLALRVLWVACALGCTAASAQAPAAPPESPSISPQSNLTADLFYQLLVAEISAQNGDGASAYALMLDAARKSNAQELYERAVELALTGRSGESALVAAQGWSRALPASEVATRYALQILVGLNRIADTTEVIKRHLAAVSGKERTAAIIALPRYFARAADKRQAASAVELALEADLTQPAWGPAAWTAVGTLRLMAGDKEGALLAAQRGAGISPTASEPVSLALAMMESPGDAAENIVTRYLAANPAIEIRLAYVRKLLDSQRFAVALEQSKLATASNPASADSWLIRGSLEFQEKLWAASQDSLKKYLELAKRISTDSEAGSQDRGLTQAYFLLSQIAEQDKRFDEANGYLDQIDAPSEAVRVQTRKASLLAKQGRLDEALKLLQNAPETQPDDARLKITAQAQLLRDFKRYKAAYELLSSAVQQFPQDVDLLYDLAMSAEKIGNVAEMETLLRRIIASKPDYHHAYNALGYSLADRDQRLPEARQLIQKALEFAPEDPYILDSLGWVEFRSGNLDEALRILKNAYQAKPDPEISAHLGEVLWALQRKDDAMATWKAGLALNGDNETLNETIRRLAKP